MHKIASWITGHELPSIILLSLVFFTLRLLQIDQCFAGLHVDEAGIKYDAYALAEFHVDRYLNSFPVYMINYGGGQSCLYTYLVALLFKITGSTSTFLLRLPIVISNYLLCLCSALLVRDFKGKAAGIAGFAVFILMPYAVMQSRFGLDCNLLVSSLAIVTYCLHRAVQKKGCLRFFAVGILIGVALYTYSLSWLIYPVYLIILLVLLLRFHQIDARGILCLLIPAAILAVPLFLFLYINLTGAPTMHVWIFTIPHLPQFRAGELSAANIMQNWKILATFLTSDSYSYNADSRIGAVNYIMIPVFIIGVFAMFRSLQKQEAHDMSLEHYALASFSSVYLIALLTKDCNISKGNGIYYSIFLIEMLGLICLYHQRKAAFHIIFSIYLATSFLFAALLPKLLSSPLYLFSDSYGEAIALAEKKYPSLPIYAETLTKSPSGFYLAEALPDPYSLTISEDGLTINQIHFSLPEDLHQPGVYIMTESNVEAISDLYAYYEQYPEKVILSSYGEYQIYVVLS